MVEFWDGMERTCPHRCELQWGLCDLTLATVSKRNKDDFEDSFFNAINKELLTDAMEVQFLSSPDDPPCTRDARPRDSDNPPALIGAQGWRRGEQ